MTRGGAPDGLTDFLRLEKVQHFNLIVDGYERSVQHFRHLFGAHLNHEVFVGPDVDACLMTLGPIIFELFAPKHQFERGQGRLLRRYGPHFIGVEYQVADVSTARQALEARGVRLLHDPGTFFFTHPADTFGVSLEIFDGDFYGPVPPVPGMVPVAPNEYWQNEHPLGILGLHHYTVAVTDLDEASGRWRELTGTQELYRHDRPSVDANVVGLEAGDATLELIAPLGSGSVQDYLARYGPGIRSVTFQVNDLETVERYFADRDIEVIAGDGPGAQAVARGCNEGLMFEFSE